MEIPANLHVLSFVNDLFEFEAAVATSSADAKSLDRPVESVSAANRVVQAFRSRGATG